MNRLEQEKTQLNRLKHKETQPNSQEQQTKRKLPNKNTK